MKLQDRAKKCLCISAALMLLALILSIFGLGILPETANILVFI